MKNKVLIIGGSVIAFGIIAYFLLNKKKSIIVNNEKPIVTDNSILSENKLSERVIIPQATEQTTYKPASNPVYSENLLPVITPSIQDVSAYKPESNPVYTESKPLTVITPAITEQSTYQPASNPVYIASEPTPVISSFNRTIIAYEI